MAVGAEASGRYGSRAWRTVAASRPRAWHVAVFYVAYVLTGHLCDGLALIPGVLIIFWPPVGILVATLLSNPRSSWPWWLVAGGAAELTCNALLFHNPVGLAATYYAGNALEALAAAWLLQRFCGRDFRLESHRELAALVLLGAGIAPVISATVIAGTDALIGKHAFATAWPLVWLGDGSGLLVSTPLTLTVIQTWRERARRARSRVIEAVITAVVLVGLTAAALHGWLPTVYVVLPALLWAALRFQLKGAATAVGIVTVVTATLTASGRGEFVGEPELAHERAVVLQVFLAVCAVSAVLVAALSRQREEAAAAVHSLNAELEARVEERTRALDASEASLQRFLDTAATGLVRVGRDLRYLAANEAYARLVGRPAAEIVGSSLADVLGAESVATVQPHLARVLAGERVEFEAELELRGAGKRWIHVNCTPERDASGVVGGWVESVTDVTPRKQAELRLRDREALLRLALEAAGMGAWRMDLQSGGFQSSPEADAIHGREPGSVTTVAESATGIHPEDRARVAALVREAVSSGGRYCAEYRTVWPDGSVRWVATAAQAELDASGRPTGVVVGAVRDVTEARVNEAALRHAADELTAADRRKDEFLAMLAHELRNPLAPIRSTTELLARRTRADPELREAVGVLARQTEQLTRLVDDLLDVSRIAQGRIVLDVQPLDVATLVAQAVEAVRPLVTERSHRLVVPPVAADLHVRGDRVRLVQSLANVLHNAAKYTDPGGTIRLDVEATSAEIELRVVDDGNGIPATLLPRVFDLFVQNERTLDRSQGGLGIGLSIVKRLVEMHGGAVAAESDGPGRGATFTLRLPRTAAPQAGGVGAAPVPAGARRRVLVVDDNADAADTLATVLRLDGHEVVTAYGALDALAVAERAVPDVVLLDIGLPQLDGYEVARRLRSNPALVRTRLVALSGYGREEDRARARAAGFDEHLVKPADVDAVARVLEVPIEAA